MSERRGTSLWQDVAIVIATILALNIVQLLFGKAVVLAVAVTLLTCLIAFLYHVGGKRDRT